MFQPMHCTAVWMLKVADHDDCSTYIIVKIWDTVSSDGENLTLGACVRPLSHSLPRKQLSTTVFIHKFLWPVKLTTLSTSINSHYTHLK